MIFTPETKALIDERKKDFTGLEVATMEKVLLTKKQAEAIEEIKDKDYAINVLALKKRPDHALATLEISQVAKLLYGLAKYEIKPEKPMFEPGDKIVNADGSPISFNTYIATFQGANHLGLRFLEGHYGVFVGEKFRHATPEEIYWLETLGRKKVGEFRVGDVMLDKDGEPLLYEDNISDPHQFAKWYSEGDFLGLYPAASFKPFPGEGAL